jgi:hypothetical protein
LKAETRLSAAARVDDGHPLGSCVCTDHNAIYQHRGSLMLVKSSAMASSWDMRKDLLCLIDGSDRGVAHYIERILIMRHVRRQLP